jgi:hypothetical protein
VLATTIKHMIHSTLQEAKANVKEYMNAVEKLNEKHGIREEGSDAEYAPEIYLYTKYYDEVNEVQSLCTLFIK